MPNLWHWCYWGGIPASAMNKFAIQADVSGAEVQRLSLFGHRRACAKVRITYYDLWSVRHVR